MHLYIAKIKKSITSNKRKRLLVLAADMKNATEAANEWIRNQTGMRSWVVDTIEWVNGPALKERHVILLETFQKQEDENEGN